ncbi:MAG TPA: c-type cytochrome biogenesis protein CcmI [Dongiaceae bacterium]|jgi:cytochrome c-type biogenesis protein CcmH
MIWLFVAIITVIVVGLLLLPLFRQGTPAQLRRRQELAIYGDQLAELQREADAGLIGAETAAAAKLEIERKILARGKEPDSSAAAEPSAAGARMAAVIVVASLAPLAAFAIYLATGAPSEPAHPYAAEADHSGQDAMTAAEMTVLVEKLAAHLQQSPNNVEGWKLLARSYGALERPGDAANAYARALDLAPGDMVVATELADALTQTADGIVPPKAVELFTQASKADPAAPKPRYYLAMAKAQSGQAREALAMLRSLEIDSPADAPWLPSVRARIDEIAKNSGIDASSIEAKSAAPIAGPGGPSAADIEAAQSMTPEEQGAMIRGMVDRLAKRLESEPNDLEGWKRLGQSYFVLNEPARARDAYGRAVALAPADIGLLAEYAGTLLAAPNGAAPLPAESVAALQAALEREPKNGAALWLLGFAAMKEGRKDEARRLWSQLLAQFAPGSAEHTAVKNEIDKL